MKYIWFCFSIFIFQNVQAHVLTVTDIQVSASAESAATAREQALDQAHSLAFEKLMQEKFPEISHPLPPLETLINMVTDFSINREKTTPTSYAASLTFQFDEARVQAWIQQGFKSSAPSFSRHRIKEKGNLLRLTASYTALSQWLHIKNTLATLPEVQKVTLKSLSPLQATIEITYMGDMEKLQQSLQQSECLLSFQGGSGVLTSLR